MPAVTKRCMLAGGARLAGSMRSAVAMAALAAALTLAFVSVAGAQVLPPGTDSDCAGQVPVVVASDAAAQSDLYSAVTLAGVLDTTCVVLAGPRDAAMDVAQRARLEAAATGGWVVGGTVAVPYSKVAGFNLKRLGGVDRWHTARLVGAVAANLNQFTQLRLTAGSKLSPQGLGPVHIGHQLEDAVTAAGVGFSVGDDREGCAVYVADDQALTGVTFTLLDDEVHRIDIAAGSVTTLSGYGIGSAEADIRAAFGDRIDDGPVQGTIQYVPTNTGDLDKRVVWEVDADGAVTRMWTGRLPLVNDLVPCFSRWTN